MTEKICVVTEKVTFIGFSAALKSLDSSLTGNINSIVNITRSNVKKGKYCVKNNAVYVVL